MTAALVTALIFASSGLLALIIARRVPLPFPLLLVLLGFGLSFVVEHSQWDTGIRFSNFDVLVQYILLPILIFESAWALDETLLKRYMPNILTLATLGLVISTVISATILFYGINHVGFPIIAALLTGAIISATDPSAVVAQLRTLKAPEELSTLLEGESLFNDATAIVLFGVLLAIAQGLAEPSVSTGLIAFAKVFGGGIVVGVVMGVIASGLIRLINRSVPHVALLSLLLAYGSFLIAEDVLHMSGIVAVLFAALSFKKLSCPSFSGLYDKVNHVWESLAFIANVFLFTLLGLVISVDMFTDMYIAVALGIGAALLSRLIAVYSSVGINHFTFGQPVPSAYPVLMVWGGLRGAVAVALVLSLPTDIPYWYTIQSIGYGVVVFTLIVQATTNPMLTKRILAKE